MGRSGTLRMTRHTDVLITEGKPMHPKRKSKPSTKILSVRLSPDELALIRRARWIHPEGIRGISWFAREALLDWAHLTIARRGPSSRKERAA
jgi:hypothetical protein